MSKVHDENKDLRSLSKVAKINMVTKTITIQDKSRIGIKRWGMIDYLTKYKGYVCAYEHNGYFCNYGENILIAPNNTDDENKQSKRSIKKALKAPKLKDKRR